MNLTSERVTHAAFGDGRVKSVENGHITIEFAESIGEKSFHYPGAFKQFLKMQNPAAQSFVTKVLIDYMMKEAAEKAEKSKERLEEQERLQAEQLALRKAAKKPAKKKVAATK